MVPQANFAHRAKLVIIGALLLQHLIPFTPDTFPEAPGFIVLFIIVSFLQIIPAFHLTLFMALAYLLRQVLPDHMANFSGIYLGALFLVTVPIVRKYPATRPLLAWLRVGKIDRFGIASIFVVSLVSAIALLLWGYWTDHIGSGEVITKSFAHLPRALILVVGVPLFALLNAFSEEVTYRGIFQEAALRSGFSPGVSIVVQAMGFASIHYAQGFPNGVMGYLMTFLYGSVLGYLRHRGQGILIPYLTHVTADVVLMYFLCWKFL